MSTFSNTNIGAHGMAYCIICTDGPEQIMYSNCETFCPIHYFLDRLTQTGLASVVKLDAHPTGDQEVAGSTPAGSAAFFRGV